MQHCIFSSCYTTLWGFGKFVNLLSHSPQDFSRARSQQHMRQSCEKFRTSAQFLRNPREVSHSIMQVQRLLLISTCANTIARLRQTIPMKAVTLRLHVKRRRAIQLLSRAACYESGFLCFGAGDFCGAKLWGVIEFACRNCNEARYLVLSTGCHVGRGWCKQSRGVSFWRQRCDESERLDRSFERGVGGLVEGISFAMLVTVERFRLIVTLGSY